MPRPSSAPSRPWGTALRRLRRRSPRAFRQADHALHGGQGRIAGEAQRRRPRRERPRPRQREPQRPQVHARYRRVVELATQIHRSRRILVVGVDLAASLAWFLAYGLMPLGLNAEAPVGSAGNLQHKIDGLGDKDLLIAISFGRCLGTRCMRCCARGAGRADVRHHRRQYHADRDALRRAPARADQQSVVHRLLCRADGADQRDHAGLRAPATQRALAILRRPKRNTDPASAGTGTAAPPPSAAAATAVAPNAPLRQTAPTAEAADELTMSRSAQWRLHVTNCVHHRSSSVALPSPPASRWPTPRAQGTRLLRRPAVSRELVAFEYGGDLWTVPRSGGQARRLTSTPSAEIDPWFSPDGSRIAFTATVGGNTDVYVMPADRRRAHASDVPSGPGCGARLEPRRQPRALRVDARNRARPRPALDLQALVGGRRAHRRGQRGSGTVADAARLHRTLFARRPSRRVRRDRRSGSRPTGRRTRAACGGTIAAAARVRSA